MPCTLDMHTMVRRRLQYIFQGQGIKFWILSPSMPLVPLQSKKKCTIRVWENLYNVYEKCQPQWNKSTISKYDLPEEKSFVIFKL